MKKQISKKEDGWMEQLAAQEAKRAAANQEALQKAQAQALEKISAQAQAQALQFFSQEAQAYQEAREKEALAILEKAQRKIRAKGAAHKDSKSPYGKHRLNSEGAQMDEALQRFNRANPEAAMPSPEDLMEFAKGQNIAMPYDAKRIKGHLNFLQREHSANLPDALKRK